MWSFEKADRDGYKWFDLKNLSIHSSKAEHTQRHTHTIYVYICITNIYPIHNWHINRNFYANVYIDSHLHICI